MTKQELLNKIYEAERIRISSATDDRGDYAHPVFGDGSCDANVVFIGEAPGKDEAELGCPFVGKAGKQLDRMLELSGIQRAELYVTNVVKFRPWKKNTANGRTTVSNRTPNAGEVKNGATVVQEEIRIIKPKVIVTLGNTPLSCIELITGRRIGKIGDVHGSFIRDEKLDAIIVPLYHPASGIYNRQLVPIMENDLIRLGSFI